MLFTRQATGRSSRRARGRPRCRHRKNFGDAPALVEVQTRQFEVYRAFHGFDDYWRTAHGSPRLRELFAALSPSDLQRLSERARGQIGSAAEGPLVMKARANAVKGRKR